MRWWLRLYTIIRIPVVVLQAINLLLHILYDFKNNINNMVGNASVKVRVGVRIHVPSQTLHWSGSKDGGVFSPMVVGGVLPSRVVKVRILRVLQLVHCLQC